MAGSSRRRRRDDAAIEQRVDLGIARLAPDPDRPGAWSLSVDGTPQSHVDVDDPTYLEFEYVRWLGHLVDAMAPAGDPLRVLHLGGGAATLARYVAATRPGSGQLVVELDVALVELVRRHLPPPGAGIRIRSGDARAALQGLPDARFDLVVSDVFRSARVPAHLTSTGYLGQVSRVLRPGGVYAANLADGPGLRFVRAQVATARTVLPELALIGSAQVLRGRRFGNLLLVGSSAALPLVELTRRTAGDGFPARVTAGAELARLAGSAQPTDDAGATPSPAPPDAIFG